MKERPAPVDSIVGLARALIAVPSQGGIDSAAPVVAVLGDWLADHGLEPTLLQSATGEPVGLGVDIGPEGGPHFCLDACLDTAPIGDPSAWSFPPTAGVVRDGWLGGRGAADAKTAVAIFAHLGLELASRPKAPAGRVTLLFDADEHTGHFGGIRAYLARHGRPHGVMIGYPGPDVIVVGARGFWRGTATVFGHGGHSGSRAAPLDNAVVKAAGLAARLSGLDLPAGGGGDFDLGPKITVTGIQGGEGYTVVPDRCSVSIDVRLTPRFDAAWAESLVRTLCRSLDRAVPSRRPTIVAADTTWPAYRLPASSPLATALRSAAAQEAGREVPLVVAGPSNIGNYLSTQGVEATCGFGVRHRNLHRADEAIEVATIPSVYHTYRGALDRLACR